MHSTFFYTTCLLFASIIILVTLERIFPYRKGLPFFREGFWVDLIWYTLIQSYFLKIFIFDVIIHPADKALHLSSLQLVSNWPVWSQVLFFLVTHDLYIYWFHRWQHRSKILWRTHEAHHSNKGVDWLAGTRSHSLEILINQPIEFPPIVLLGANPIVIPIKALLDAVQAGARKLGVVLMRDPWDAEFLAPGVAAVTAYGWRRCQLDAAMARLLT